MEADHWRQFVQEKSSMCLAPARSYECYLYVCIQDPGVILYIEVFRQVWLACEFSTLSSFFTLITCIKEKTPCAQLFFSVFIEHAPLLSVVLHAISIIYMCFTFFFLVSLIVCFLTLRRLMSYIYMEHPFLMFLDHTQRRSTVGRTPLDE